MIPRLEQVSIGKRIALTIAIVIVVLLLLWLLELALNREPAEAQQSAPPSPYDRHLLELDKQALEDGYRAQLQHVYSTWMRDYHLGQSSRAATGFSNARKAYIEAKGELEKREKAINR